MPTTLSRLSPFSRLALLRRTPFWTQALALCALFAIVGAAVVGDYGVGWDEHTYRRVAVANIAYIATGDISELSQHREPGYRYYGMPLDMPLLLLERALGLQDTRHIYLMRHLLTHLFFIAGGFVCGMLAYRTIGNRWVALLAMLMFLLHPRLYAHSFFNIKDIPFAALLLIALYLARHAFRKDTIGAFLLCGVVAGLAINLRPFGLMLLPMLLAMRGLDLWQASDRAERRGVLITGAAFLAAALATAYITHPYYWENPLRFIEGVLEMSQHPSIVSNLFMGEIYRSDAVPWNYIPVWFAITAPPVALALGAIGCLAVCWQAITRPLAALRDRELRFRVLLLGCVALPVAVAIILQANIYHGWRHMYFLWGPFCLLAAVGLCAVANIRMGGVWKVMAWLPGWARGGRRSHMARRALVYGVAGAGLLTTLTAMVALHPHQHVYFNALVDTNTPGALAERYDMDYMQVAHRQLLENLLARYPDDTLRVWPRRESLRILPQNDREHVLISKGPYLADYLLYPFFKSPGLHLDEERPAIHSVGAYGSVLAFTVDRGSDAYLDYYRAEYADIEANGTLLARGDFDVYIHDGALRYLKENCEPPLENSSGNINAGNINANIKVFLHIFPADRADLPAHRREHDSDNRDFSVPDPGAFFDGKCIHRQLPLPDYSLARIRTGQIARGETLWSVDIDLAARAAAQTLYEGIAAGDYGKPVAQSDFDLYLSGNALAYLKENCAPADVVGRFFLHIFPADPADLPSDRREFGFENRNFWFIDRGAYAGDKCVAERELPDYAIERIRTGQFVGGEGMIWGVEFPVSR